MIVGDEQFEIAECLGEHRPHGVTDEPFSGEGRHTDRAVHSFVLDMRGCLRALPAGVRDVAR